MMAGTTQDDASAEEARRMSEPKILSISLKEGFGIDTEVFFYDGPEAVNVRVRLPEQDYSIEEYKRLAVRRSYELLRRTLAERPAGCWVSLSRMG